MGLKDFVAVALLLVCGGGWFLYRRYTAAVLSSKLKTAARSKLKTIELLEERGFTVIDCQQSVEVDSIIDGKSYTDVFTVDFVAQKDGQRFLVKSVSGGQLPRLGYRENREPLMTLTALFSIPNILLVDPERKNIRYMKNSPKKSLAKRIKSLVNIILIFLSGAFCVIIIRYLFL